MKKKKYIPIEKRKGAMALMLVVVVGASALLMAVGASRLGLGELEMGYVSDKADEALYLADGCIEEGLRRLRLDSAYPGEIFTLGGGTCDLVISISGSDRVLSVKANIDGQYNKKIEASATLVGTDIVLNSWKEVVL